MISDKTVKILFVEDMPSDVELAVRELKKNNFHFAYERVDTKDAYLQKLSELKPDIVISDYAMPEFDGMVALKLLQDFDKKIPLVVLTGSLNEDIAVECLRAGASDYVIKEHITRLPYAVTEALSQSRNRCEKEAAEEALKQKTEELNNYFTNALDLFCIIDLDGCFKRLNKTWETIFGYSINELEGSLLLSYVHSEDEESTSAAINSLVNNNDVLNFVNRHRCKDNSYKWIEWRASRVESMIYAAARDITERKTAEENLREANSKLEAAIKQLTETQKQVLFQEKMRSLGQMTSGICHDINNALTPIMGYVDILISDESLQDNYGQVFQRILKSTNDIAKTISRLREFYKSDLKVSELKELKINEIITDTIELTKHRWKNISDMSGAVIEIKTDLYAGLPQTVGDETEIVEALTNLILNACDAMPLGGILSFTTLQDNGHICIEVKDTGIGMDEETLQRCLDPFFTTKGKQGTGLGLSMVFGIVERHKGEIKIESRPGNGTTVILKLPIKKNIEINNVTENSPSIAINTKLKILSVEDDPVIAEMLMLMLEKKGFEVVSARNGKKGLVKFQQAVDEGKPFNLVITDLGMAEMDGISFSKLAKKISPGIPVILLTGFGSLLEETDLLSIDYLLNKPLMSSELMKAISKLTSSQKIS